MMHRCGACPLLPTNRAQLIPHSDNSFVSLVARAGVRGREPAGQGTQEGVEEAVPRRPRRLARWGVGGGGWRKRVRTAALQTGVTLRRDTSLLGINPGS